MRTLRHTDRMLLFFIVLLALAPATRAVAEIPEPVSPGSAHEASVIELRCPTFTWAGIADAETYELAVYRVSGAEKAVELRIMELWSVELPGTASAFTPDLSQCLTEGERYAWAIRARSGGEAGEWSPPLEFAIPAAPGAAEVREAIETLRRFIRQADSDPTLAAEIRTLFRTGGAGVVHRWIAPFPNEGAAPDLHRFAAPAYGPTAGTKSAPVPGAGAIGLSGGINLSAASNLFKDGATFLWDDTGLQNVAVGRNALSSVTTGSQNTALGEDALLANDVGGGNVAIGEDAMLMNLAGILNTTVGHQALAANTNGNFNTAIGETALASNTTAWDNTAIGGDAMFSNQVGERNTAVGGDSLRDNVSGNNNVAMGNDTLGDNLASDNTAVGADALRLNTTGAHNTVLGRNAANNNVDGNNNTAIGSSALFFNTNGSSNVAIGRFAAHSNTSGLQNIAIGRQALNNNETASSNTAVGDRALQNASGANNTALGILAGSNLFTGTGNLYLANPGVNPESDTIRVGDAQTRTYIAGIRGTTTGVNDAITVVIDSNGQLGTLSSSRSLKYDIEGLEAVDDRLLALRPVSFRYNWHGEEGPVQFGLIAEEVAEVFPELVVFNEERQPETVRYHLLSTLLLNELKRQHARIEALEAARALPPR